MSVRDRHGSQSMPPPLCRKPLRPSGPSRPSSSGFRNDSLSTRFQKLDLNATPRSSTDSHPSRPASPSKLPRPATPLPQGPDTGWLDYSRPLAARPAPSSRRAPNTSIPSPLKYPQDVVSASKNCSPLKSIPQRKFLTPYSNLETFDFDERANEEALAYNEFRQYYQESMQGSIHSVETLKTHAIAQQAAIRSLEEKNATIEQKYFQLKEDNTSTRIEKESLRVEKELLEHRSKDLEEKHHRETCDLKEKHAREVSHLNEKHAGEVSHLDEKISILKEKHTKETCDLKEKMANKDMEHDLLTAKRASEFQEELARFKAEFEKQAQERHEEMVRLAAAEREKTAREHEQELARLTAQLQLGSQREEQLAADYEQRSREQDAQHTKGAFEYEKRMQIKELEFQSKMTATELSLQKEKQLLQDQLQAKIRYLESDQQSQSASYAAMEKARDEALACAVAETNKARKLETQRRKLHDQVQNLKGNIRVICRQRPALPSDGTPTELAVVDFLDEDEMKSIEVRGPEEKSSLGTTTTKKYPFTFDRAFGPVSTNEDVYQQVEPMVQSAVDGYNVCFFAYGQTGSGKTHTMSANDGIMPRATQKIYQDVKQLKEMGWTYTLQGSFVEIYNENINDLLGDAEQMDKKKHDIHHDTKAGETTITGVTVIDLDSEETVTKTVEQAMARRSVAATKLNERSSRSHSVFILKLSGHNSVTGEVSRGTLNLVDLAGSERVSRSMVEGDRLKETQNINKSLSCLKDVIAALGATGTSHIPYRNSKLTHLLQLSLGGNSKTLMFVTVSPLKEHLGESLSSLRFAAQVNATHIGTAKKVR